MSLVSLGSPSTVWTPISPLSGDSQTRQKRSGETSISWVARAKGFRPMTASHKRSRPRKDHARPVAHPEHPPKLVAFQTRDSSLANGSGFHAVIQTGGLLSLKIFPSQHLSI